MVMFTIAESVKKSPKKRQIPVNFITCYHMWVLHKIHDKHSWNLEVSSENPEITGTQEIHAEPTNFPLSPQIKKWMTGQRPSGKKRSQMIFVYTPQIRDGCPKMIEPVWKCIETAIFWYGGICGMNSSSNFGGVKGCASKKSSKWKLSRAANVVIGHDRTMTTIGKQKKFCELAAILQCSLQFLKNPKCKEENTWKKPQCWVSFCCPPWN